MLFLLPPSPRVRYALLGRLLLIFGNGSVLEEKMEMLEWYLNWSYVLRDSWTKLNVAPAKIMQVCAGKREQNSRTASHL